METNSTVTIGCDLGDRYSETCVLDAAGEVVLRQRVATKKRALHRFFGSYAGATVVIEASTHSRWVSALLSSLGCGVIVANPRRLPSICQSTRKNDRNDAEALARLGRADPKLLHPVRHRGEEAQQDLLWIRARDALVRSRASLVSCARGLVKTMGQRIPTCSTAVFAQRARESVSVELSASLEPLLAGIESHTEQIARYDKSIEEVAQRYPETARLREISGVGPLCSLAFVLTLEDHGRFKRSRDVGPYLGLTPRQHQSGESNPQLRITKAGDPYLRRLLVTSAQHILRRHGQDTDLRRFGLRLMERGGKRAKKVAVVAVARKLGVLMHRLWASGESYVPLGYTRRTAA